MVITKIRNLLKVVGISLNEDIQTSFYAVNFLDIYIFKKENRLMTSLYQKPMNNFLYLPFSSMHPTSTLTGWIKGELIRMQRYTSLRTDYNASKALFYCRLLARCYPKFILDPIFSRINFTLIPKIDKPEALSLILPYGKRNLSSLTTVIKKHSDKFIVSTGFKLRTTWSTDRSISAQLVRH
jgi:hypothetical protein